MTNKTSDINGTAYGSQIHDPYFAMWPHKVLNVYDRESPRGRPWDRTPPAEPEPPAKPNGSIVAIIDTSVAVYHPNLIDAIDKFRAIDLVSTKLGTFPYIYPDETKYADEPAELPDLQLNESSAIFEGSNAPVQRLWRALCKRCREGQYALSNSNATGTPSLVQPATAWQNSAHGTAIAGLIGARPVHRRVVDYSIPGRPPEDNMDNAATEVKDARNIPIRSAPLPFAGIDPFCKMVPIATGFDPDPEQFILALMYTELIEADIVVIPRDFPDPWRTRPKLEFITPPISVEESSPELLNKHDTRQIKEKWDALHEVIRIIADKRILVCAGGNNDDGMPIYPASWVFEGKGGNKNDRHQNIISVGAVTHSGELASYSIRGNGVTVMAPSGDEERYDRSEVRFNKQRPGFDADEVKADFPKRADAASMPTHLKFDYHEVISTDLPGNFGYNYGSFEKPFLETRRERKLRQKSSRSDELLFKMPILDKGSFYCAFGGTSAATAIASGFISLGISTDDIPKKDQEKPTAKNIRDWLEERMVEPDGKDFNVLDWDANR